MGLSPKKTSTTPPTTKRYSLSLPQPLFDELEAIATKQGVSVVDVMRSCFKLGSLVFKIQNNPSQSLVWRKEHGQKEAEIYILDYDSELP